jgi:hypothetical protein
MYFHCPRACFGGDQLLHGTKSFKASLKGLVLFFARCMAFHSTFIVVRGLPLAINSHWML